LGIRSLSRAKKQKLDKAAAMVVYMGACLFSLFDDPYMKAFVDLLSEYLYTALNRNRIGIDLLDEIYLEVKGKVLALLEEQEYLQFVLDKSPDLNHRWIVNLSMVLPNFGSFYLENDHVGDKSLTAAFFVDWFFRKTNVYCSDPRRIGSLVTNTCATMRKT
jgi:hypothetical protein